MSILPLLGEIKSLSFAEIRKISLNMNFKLRTSFFELQQSQVSLLP